MHSLSINKLRYYAKILIVVSFTFIIYGSVLLYSNRVNYLDPINDYYDTEEEENTVSVTPADTNEVVLEGDSSNNTVPVDNGNNSVSNIPSNSSNGNSSNIANSDNTSTSNNTSNNKENAVNEVRPVDDPNNNLRNQIQNTYGISVLYGSETAGYSVGGLATTAISDSNVISSQLQYLNIALGNFPNDFFLEIKNGGIPLTVILINNYSDNNVTGVTDSSYSNATISVAAVHPFFDSFYHETYHYIERYLFKKGANYSGWDHFNPDDFSYGTINKNLSYSNTFLENVYFVNDYSQTDAAEDRASTFEYMMADNKASCLNQNNPVWYKSVNMARTIETVMNTVKPSVTEYWERFL